MQSDENPVRKLRRHQSAGVAAVLGIFGMQFWRAHSHSQAERIAIDIFIVLGVVAICFYVARVIVPLQELRRSKPE
jgi:uncharacterized membrane protein